MKIKIYPENYYQGDIENNLGQEEFAKSVKSLENNKIKELNDKLKKELSNKKNFIKVANDKK